MSDSSLPVAIVDYLRARSSGTDDSFAQAANLVATGAGLTDAQLASPPAPGLEAVWNVFLKTQSKAAPAAGAATASSSQAQGSSNSAPTGSSSAASPENDGKNPSAEDKAAADKLKAEGNKAMSGKDYGAAIAAYTKAIKLDATSPVYFSNRAAAYSQAGAHDRAVEDAEAALALDSKFSKAYSRMGHALFSLGKYQDAAEAYQKGVELDPSSKVMQAGLETAKKQLSDSSNDAGASPGTPTSRESGAEAGAQANANPLAGLAGLGGLGGGGSDRLSDMMNNPQMQQMAANMMQNGSLQQLMSNPAVRSMAERFGQNGGAPE